MTITLSLARREAVAEVATRYDVPIIEDDDYGALTELSPPPLAALAPHLTYHIAGLAKCLSPALQMAYLVAPNAWTAARLTSVLRATAGTVSPLSAAVASHWIEDGTASLVLQAIRNESAERREIARRMLPRAQLAMPAEGFHLWLRLPEPWTSGEFVGGLRHAGMGIVGREAFSVGPSPEAVRIALGANVSRQQLANGLGQVADLLTQLPVMSSTVV